MTERALVLFSGGQDSTVCLAWALDRFDHVETIGFDYGQRHIIEMQCRQTVRKHIGEQFPVWVPKLGADHVLDLGILKDISKTALTQDMDIRMQANGLPNTFVPGRNLLFFTLAAAVAYRLGIQNMVGGMCETDYSGYPDCRDATLKSLQATLNLGMETDFIIHTPIMSINKAQTWSLAELLGGRALVDLIREDTHSCYMGERGTKYVWGYGCNACPACNLRRDGYITFANEGSSS
jgi:7-cyano-7-deazaguanine synthase